MPSWLHIMDCRYGAKRRTVRALVYLFSFLSRRLTLRVRAKYPLSIVAKAMDTFGSNILVGYDIGCVFGGTILSSSLGTRFQESGSRTCVNAFHGYSHNYQCQLKNHPNNIAGMGLEDLETLERVFSSSNALAAVTRYSSAYR